MPEEFDDLAQSLLADDDQPIEPAIEPTEPDPEPEPAPADPQPTEPPVEPTTLEPPVVEDKSAKAFAEMRAQKTQYERMLKSLADAEGLPLEEYMVKASEEAARKRAEKMQVPPEVLTRLEQLEAADMELRRMRAENYMQGEFHKLQTDMGVTDAELNSFVTQLVSEGFNFYDTKVDYRALYKGRNFEQLVEKQRQAWIAQSQKADKAPTTVAKNGKPENRSLGEEVTSIDEMNSILEASKKF